MLLSQYPRFVWVVCIGLSLCSVNRDAKAEQPTKIQFSTVMLSQERNGWRVLLLDRTSSKYGLTSGDLVTGVDGNDAAKLGPLALAAFMSNAFVRAFPLVIVHQDRAKTLTFYRSDGKVPAYKQLVNSSKVARGMVAPEFSLPNLQTRQTVHLTDYRGKWVLLNFWATWCLPCQEEAPILSTLATSFSKQLEVVAVAVQDDHTKLMNFAAQRKPKYTILESGDLKSAIAISYGVNNGMGSATVPFSVLIRPNGTIAYVQGGYEAPSPLEKQVDDFITAE